MKIKHIDRHYSAVAKDYFFVVVYENGDGEQVPCYKALSEEAKRFIANADFQFMQSRSGHYFHRFS